MDGHARCGAGGRDIPAHLDQPTFTVIARATGSSGQQWRTEPVEGTSKKASQWAAADRLLDLLVQDGITGRIELASFQK